MTVYREIKDGWQGIVDLTEKDLRDVAVLDAAASTQGNVTITGIGAKRTVSGEVYYYLTPKVF